MKQAYRFGRTHRLSKIALKKFVWCLRFLCVMVISPLAFADWTVSSGSEIYFVSIKNNSVGEINSFEGLSGSISLAGKVRVAVDLASVDTGIDLRNERLKQIFFDVANFPMATITANLTRGQTAKLIADGVNTDVIEVKINLHGNTVSKFAHLSVASSDGNVRVTTTKPIVITAQEFGLEPGIAALQQIAGLNAISQSIPINVDLRLTAD